MQEKVSKAAPPAVLLAPMAGFSNAAMRRACHAHGAARSFTEMVSAVGLLHASDSTWELLETFEDEGPVSAHLYGTEPAAFAEAARRVVALGRFSGIDVNAGCPVRKVTCSGAGAALLRDPARIGRIVAAIRGACDLSVTVKTRLGLHPGEVRVFDVLDAVEQAGGAALAVHARFASQGHSGPVDLERLAEVKRRARIPVIGNGGIRSVADARRLVATSGVDAVMIGRAALGHPWLFGEVAAALADPARERLTPRVPLEEVRRALFAQLEDERELARRLAARDGERGRPPPRPTLEEAVVTAFRCRLFHYVTGLKGATVLRGRLNTLRTLDDVRREVDICLAREAAYRESGLT